MPQKTPSQTPVRSPSQRMEALQKANAIRSQRAQLKKELKSGELEIVTVLQDPPEFLKTAKVIDLLLVVPKFGRVKASRVLTRCRISQAKTVGGLSERQRTELCETLEKHNTAS
ncbi:MAG: integration host factor, actinobacterial type [Gaiellales bacterium]